MKSARSKPVLALVVAALLLGAWFLRRAASMEQTGWSALAGLVLAALAALPLLRAGGKRRDKTKFHPTAEPRVGQAEVDEPRPRYFPRWFSIPALGLVLLLGGWLRLSGSDWDDGHHLHPDERFLTMVASALEWPESLGEYLDEARSPLNPRNRGFAFYVYGTLPTTLVKAAARWTGRDGYDRIHLLGRRVSGVLETLTILLVFLIARRLYRDDRTALLAALFMSLAVLPIQHAHFFVADPWVCFFLALALWALAGARREGCWRDFLLAGLFWGLALACKLSVWSFVVMFPALGLDLLIRQRQSLPSLAWRMGAAGAVAFVAFRLGQPDTFLGPGFLGLAPSPRWLANLGEIRGMVSGAVDFPPGHQWTNRAPLWFPWWNMVVWGLGPALGIAAWAGWAGAAWRWIARRESIHLALVLWVAVFFLHQGAQWVKTMRYLLPIFPALAVLAAWGLVALLDARPKQRRLVTFLIGFVCVATLCWGLAFTSIYRRPHSRVVASRWILAHVPAGATVANEHWDDPLPLRVDGSDPFADRYRGVMLPWYDNDTPEKLQRVLDMLDSADYIVLSSNRLSDSIPRLPMRYPMTTRYYEALGDGRLGFEKAAEFTSYPSLFGFHIPDQASEEAFTVYDHPRVRIYRKSPGYDREQARALLGAVVWEDIPPLTARQASVAPNGLRLPSRRAENRDFVVNQEADHNIPGISDRNPLFVWVALMLALGAVASLVCAALLPGLPDRGWGLGRVMGCLALGWTGWMASCAGGLPWNRATIAATAVLLVVAALGVVWTRRSSLALHIKNNWKLILLQESLFWLVFGLFLAFRWWNPDLWHPVLGGEKPMNLAYLNAVVGTTEFPPENPWFAGATLNYYYFGYVLVGALIKLLNITPSTAYNLMIPTLAAALASAAFTVAAALAAPALPGTSKRRWIAAGLLGATLTTLAGNLGQVRLLWRAWLYPASAALRPEAWFWDASRMIAHAPGEAAPITEFPFFTYLFADLHAHAMALPLTLLVVGLALAWLRGKGRSRLVALGVLPLALGALGPTNAWDWPVYFALTAAILALGHGLPDRPKRLNAAVWAVAVVALLLLARALYLPYHRCFGAPYGSLEFWRGSRTPLGDYLWIHGLFLWMLAPGLIARFRELGERGRAALALAGLAAAGLIAGGLPLPGLLLALIALVVVQLADPAADKVRKAAFLCVGLAFLLHLAVEFVVLKGDISRMNTVFKLYLQSWVLLAVGAPALIARRPSAVGRRRAFRAVWWTGLLVLGAGALLYPITAVPARIQSRANREAPRGLDGGAWMMSAVLEHNGKPLKVKDDYRAIQWLIRHVEGRPVIAEANTWPVLYGWGNRYSTWTGFPSVVGWDWHQRQQRAALPDNGVQRRIDELRRFYETDDPAEALALLRRLRVDLIIVGPLERACYDAAGFAKFEAPGMRWTRIYEGGEVAIYRVDDDGQGPKR